jgi:hypothetical protein
MKAKVSKDKGRTRVSRLSDCPRIKLKNGYEVICKYLRSKSVTGNGYHTGLKDATV